jgi:hypothetical protein
MLSLRLNCSVLMLHPPRLLRVAASEDVSSFMVRWETGQKVRCVLWEWQHPKMRSVLWWNTNQKWAVRCGADNLRGSCGTVVDASCWDGLWAWWGVEKSLILVRHLSFSLYQHSYAHRWLLSFLHRPSSFILCPPSSNPLLLSLHLRMAVLSKSLACRSQ